MAAGGSAMRDTDCTVTSRRGRRGASMSLSQSGGLVRNVVFILSAALLLQVVSGDGKTLVLLDSPNIRDTHSIFFRSLAGEEINSVSQTHTKGSRLYNMHDCFIYTSKLPECLHIFF